MESIAPASPKFKARMAGFFYLLSIVTGLFGAGAGKRLAVEGEVANLAGTLCYLAVTLLLYDLLKPVSRSLSLLAALFSLAGCTLMTLGLFDLAPHYPNGIVFFGVYCLLLGYLIFRSTFMPRFVGVLLVIPGLGWLAFLWPPLAHPLIRYIMGGGLVGEGTLMLWLLAVGVDEQRWNQRAGSSMA